MDSSSENPESGDRDSGLLKRRTPGSDRLRADVNRAVGGMLNLLREASRISARLDAEVTADWIVKRAQFLGYELQAEIESLGIDKSDEEARLARLNQFFFKEKQFRCLSDVTRLADPSLAYRLNSVISSRSGAPMALELLYAYLADAIGIRLDFVDLSPTCFLRWRCGMRSRYIDITRGGSTLTSDELLNTLHSRFQMTDLSTTSCLEDRAFENFIADFVLALKATIDVAYEPEIVLFLQNTLIAYQPSELALVGERAFLHRRLGNFKLALSDLKRYFAFHDRDRAPEDLVRLYDELTKLLEQTTSSGVEVID